MSHIQTTSRPWKKLSLWLNLCQPSKRRNLDLLNASKDSKTKRQKKQAERNRRRTIHFCVGYSKIWKIPIYKTIKELKEKHKLSWLRVSMSHHRFTNLREILNGDL